MKVLLLEDEDILRKNIEKFLTLKGHKVDSFEDGGVLLEEANLFEYDFFVFDINVPDVDGFELVEYIKGKGIDTISFGRFHLLIKRGFLADIFINNEKSQ